MRTARFGDVVASMKNGIYKPASEYADDGMACLRMYNINAGSIVWRDIKRMRISAKEYAEYGLHEGDLLVNRVNSRELVGKSAYVPGTLEPSVFESKNIRVRLDQSKALPKFINYQLFARGSRHFASNAQQVVGMASISQKQLADFPIVLTNLDEQRRIIAEIEKQFSRLDEAVANLNRVGKNLKTFKGAILTETTCVDREILPTGWRWSTIGELAEVGTGATPKRDRADYWGSGTVPWVASAAVNKAIVTEPTELITEIALRETNCRVYPPGTLLVAMYGEGKTRGTCAQLGIAAATNQALAAIEAPAEIRQYLRLVLQASYLRTRRVASGGVQPNLNLSHVRAIRVPLPPLEDQRRIVEDVDRQLSVADEIANQLRVYLNRAERLRQILLANAFSVKHIGG